jgi:hypothetical protein
MPEISAPTSSRIAVTVMLMARSCGYSGSTIIISQETPCRKP